MKWTLATLHVLATRGSMTVRDINLTPEIILMNAIHLHKRKKRGATILRPVNSMVYDTLVRLRNGGYVTRRDDGVYELTAKGINHYNNIKGE